MTEGTYKNPAGAAAAWSVLVAASIGTLAVHHFLWASNWYAEVRWLLAMFSFAAAAGVVTVTWPSRKALLAVLTILAIGQLWLLETAFMRMAWSMNGFAP